MDDTDTTTTTDTTQNTALMTTWCRMWDDDPTLAYRVMTDDAVQCSLLTPGLDTVVGPEQQVAFVRAYQAQHLNRFRPRVLVDAGATFAYVWDVTLPDGTVRTGADVNVVRGGRVARNWTVAAPGRDTAPDPAPERCDPELLAAVHARFVAAADGTAHRPPVLDPARGRFAQLRTTSAGLAALDLVAVTGGEVARVWTFTGERAFRY